MPKAKLITTNGLGFEDAIRRMIATPPQPAPKPAKKAAPKAKRKK